MMLLKGYKMKKYLDYYCDLSLKDLQRRQHINAMQTIYAYKHKKTRGLIRLQRIAILLTAAVYKKCFGRI